MRQEYKDELKNLYIRMKDAENFAKEIPVFSEIILRNKLSGKESSIQFGKRYKKIQLDWGINRYYYKDNKNIINYFKEFNGGYLFNIYINTISLFDGHNNFGLLNALKNIEIFHIDRINSTFYIEDKHIEKFLETLNKWYIKALTELNQYRIFKELEEAKKNIEKLQKELNNYDTTAKIL